jgi:hypothetical protein
MRKNIPFTNNSVKKIGNGIAFLMNLNKANRMLK